VTVPKFLDGLIAALLEIFLVCVCVCERERVCVCVKRAYGFIEQPLCVLQALIDITVLWGAIAGTIYTFFPVSRLAAGLLVPYLGWVTVASTLTYCVWRDNKDRTD